jgi:hypothetical protein
MDSKHHIGTCPLKAVHQRMEDAHRLWHHALESYFDPEAFRVALQNCIQTLRTVTWLLQNNKRHIPNFDAWYSAWQDKMRADNVMRWLVNSRNKIEKQGDLGTHSMTHVSAIASYFDELPKVEINAELFDDISALFRGIQKEYLERQIVEHGILRVERRWVDGELPEWELLDALGSVYGQLAILIDDAHGQLGLPPVMLADAGSGSVQAFPAGKEHLGGKLPCMVMAESVRTADFSLKTGHRIQLRERPFKSTEVSLQEAAEHYGPSVPSGSDDVLSSLKGLARWYFDMVRHVFKIDGYHVPLFVLIHNNKPILMMEGHAHDRGEKYLLMRRVAAEVRMRGADAVIAINEAWTAPPDPDDSLKYPVDMPERGEVLLLSACSKYGEMFQLSATIRRTDGKPELDDSIEEDAGMAFIFAPVLEIRAQSGKSHS